MADVDWPLVELSHHEDGSDCLLLGVSDNGHVLGPHLKVLQKKQFNGMKQHRKLEKLKTRKTT